VSHGGGAATAQHYLVAGLLDEMLIPVVPVLLGRRPRLLRDLGSDRPELEQTQAVEAPAVTHIRYRVGAR
jgi:dihydrofolate reductase